MQNSPAAGQRTATDPSSAGPGELPFRFGPPPSGGVTVTRQALLRELNEASLLRRLTLVRGPAGAGKTTLLAQWLDALRQMNRGAAWLSLDGSDADLDVFLADLAVAFAHTGQERLAQEIRAVHAAGPGLAVERRARLIAAACNRLQERPILVLDRFEAASGTCVERLVGEILRHARAIHVVVASRRRPALPLGQLRAENQLFELDPADLNLTSAETHAVFGGLLPEIYTRRLHAATGGSPIAIQLAKRSLEEHVRPGRPPSNWRDWLNDYYHCEVLDRLDPELSRAMSRLVVARFDLSLAQALIGSDAIDVIERLQHVEGLLLQDRGTRELHFPEMLRRLLEERLLTRLEPDERSQLHARAAGWFAERGLPKEALRHATLAGDRERALALLDRIGSTNVVIDEGIPAARVLFEWIDTASDRMRLGMQLSLAVVRAHEGRTPEAVELVRQVREHLDGQDAAALEPLRHQLALTEGFVTGFLDETPGAANDEAIARYLRAASPSDHHGRALAHVLQSWSAYCRGDLAAAERLADDAALDYAGSEAVYGSLFVHIHRTLARYWRNDLDGALSEATVAANVARLFFPEDQRVRALTEALCAGLHFELGRPDGAVNPLDLVAVVGALESWAEIQLWVHRYGARAAMLAGRFDEARAVIANGIEIAGRLQTPRLAWSMRLERVLLELAQGEPDGAWREAEALGLADGAFPDSCTVRLTWQERIGGLLTLARLALDRRDRRRSDEAGARIERELTITPVPRFACALALLRAGEHAAHGRDRETQSALAAAAACCPGVLPVSLLVACGDEFRRQALRAGRHFERGTASLPAYGVAAVPSAWTGGAANDPLTERERQILQFMSEGHPNKVAAHRLGLSEATVKFHLRNIYRKLSAQNRTQALARYRDIVGAKHF